MDFDDEEEYQFADLESNIEAHDEDDEKDENLQDDFREGASAEQISEEELHFQQNIKPHILDTIQLLTSFIIFKDDEELSFEENTEVYAAKRKACIESLQDLQEITKEDLMKRERRVWTLLIENGIHKNELFSLLSHHRNDYDIVREVIDLLVILSESPDQNNPRFRKFSARGGASERKRAIFYFGKQMKIVQKFKLAILSTKYIPIITWTLMNKEKDSTLKSKMTADNEKKRVLTEADLYCVTIFKLLNNLLLIPDAKHGKVLQTEELQTRMQDVLVKQLQNDCQFLDYALVKMTKFVENYNEVSSQSEMKKLSESYLLFIKFTTMLFWNESVKDLFEASNPILPNSNEIVMSQNEENMEMDNSELKRLLRKEKMYKDQVKSLILTGRHSRFQGNLLERQSTVSKVINKNKSDQRISALLEENEEYDAEKENKKNDVKIQKTFVVQNVNHMNTAHMYAASDNPFLVGGGQQKASSTGARFGAKRFNVISDKMELRFSPSSLETRKIIKNFADDLYRGCFNTLILLALQTIIKQQEDSIAINNELDQKSTKEALDHESERNFLFLGQFMLGYNRYKYLQKKKREEQRSSGENVGFDIALISNLLKEGVVSMIFKKLLSDYFYTQNNFNLTFVVGFLRELFTTFRWMGDKSYSGSDALTWGRIVSIHLHHILYDPTNMESLVRLVRDYKPYQNSIKHLSHLVLLVDLFITVINENISIESFFMKSKKGESSTTEDNEEEEEDDSAKQRRFELDGFRRRFAIPSVLKQYMYLFRFYDVNPPEVNQAIIQIFKYVIEELDLEFMMFRASFLKLCFNILSNKTFINDSLGSFERKVNEEVIDFVLSIVKNFFKRVDEDPFTVCETLHWSTMGEVNLLNHADLGGRASRPAEADDLDGFVQSEEEEDALEAIRRDEATGVEDEEEVPQEKTEKKEKKNKKKDKKNKKKKRESEETEENQVENQEENTNETEENQEENKDEESKKKKKRDKKKDKKKKKSKKRKERDEGTEETEETEERSEKKKKKKKKKEKQQEESLQEEEEPPVEEEMADEDRLLLSSDDSDDEKTRGRLKKVTTSRASLPASFRNFDFEDE